MAERPWLSGGRGTFSSFKKQTHDEARAVMRELAHPSDTARRSLTADVWLANQNLAHIEKKRLPIDEYLVERAQWLRLKQESEKKLANLPKAVQEGARGGRFYIASTGAKVYIKDNPGAEVVGHMSAQRFHQGLPMSVHLAEPKKSR